MSSVGGGTFREDNNGREVFAGLNVITTFTNCISNFMLVFIAFTINKDALKGLSCSTEQRNVLNFFLGEERREVRRLTVIHNIEPSDVI